MGIRICRCDVADVQQSTGSDFVIATGGSHSLEEFAETVLGRVEPGWREHTDLTRPPDLAEGRGDPSRAREILGWSATYPNERRGQGNGGGRAG